MREICLTARNFGAEEAKSNGLISQIYPTPAELFAAADALAHLIASKSPIAVQGTKKVLAYAVDHCVKDGLEFVAVWNGVMLNSPDTLEAAQASMSKSVGKFAKL